MSLMSVFFKVFIEFITILFLFYVFDFFFFLFGNEACGNLAPRPGVKFAPP